MYPRYEIFGWPYSGVFDQNPNWPIPEDEKAESQIEITRVMNLPRDNLERV